MPTYMFQGSVLALTLYDVCDEINLAQLPALISGRRLPQSFKHTTPEYVRFESPPVMEPLGPVALDTGEQFEGAIQYYDYGVVSVLLQRNFSGSWCDLQQLAARWIALPLFEEFTTRLVRQRLESVRAALRNVYPTMLSEDYYVFHLPASDELTAADLIRERGQEMSQIVSGETGTLSPTECEEVLESRMSYYRNDLIVVGWNAAFLYDTSSGADTTIRLLEYANSQLLQFRHYDELLTHELKDVYSFLEARRGRLAGWRVRSPAARLRTVRLEVTQLTEHTTNALKFVGDMFSARLYKLCAAKIGVVEYQELVRDKLRTAHDLYGFMIDQFQQTRGFLLEAAVVVILLIELAYLFRGGR
ncbi:MAG TPA: hypothetical protein VIX19_16140 [Terriglobales bacterium]